MAKILNEAQPTFADARLANEFFAAEYDEAICLIPSSGNVRRGHLLNILQQCLPILALLLETRHWGLVGGGLLHPLPGFIYTGVCAVNIGHSLHNGLQFRVCNIYAFERSMAAGWLCRACCTIYGEKNSADCTYSMPQFIVRRPLLICTRF
ncbi:hypothetical protein DL89DRAFT_11337 [Linderina pennispora]|uniref:Uncharacterized protein n=1 Tax=Linderina pennispora TaxID=61395 RepID=A0A1Y1WL16_9FUNG|nr:uncharacterized protein DL89DRAFT_11337 [Linderina pennispora]ORX74182.1 hypothetical protein DL89DRAFT_11337 [Linderina pennispora]